MKKIGIYNSYLESKGGGEKVCLALAEVLSKNKKYDVRLINNEDIDLEKLAKYFQLDLSNVRLDVVGQKNLLGKILHRLPLIPQSLQNLVNEFSLFRSLKGRRYDLFINNTFYSNLPNPSKEGVYMCMFPHKLKKEPTANPIKIMYRSVLSALYRILMFRGYKRAIDTYGLITANSKFTQGYIQEYWGRESEILYPICDPMDMKDVKKEKIILNVGRFHGNLGDSHHKRQDFLVDTFKKSGLSKDGWELHFAGSVNRDKKTIDYLVSTLSKADGEPIYFHFDYPYNKLKRLFNKSTIYWHATGYGSNPDDNPEKQEHFGMSTVEAMSAGCIPVVIDAAGQKESVQKGVNGYMWNTEEKLLSNTKIATSLTSKEKKRLITNAKNTASGYDKEAFRHSVYAIFDL